MSHLILEGTWEEIASHANELIGKKVKLIVVDDLLQSQERPLSEALHGIAGMIDSLQPDGSGHPPTPFTEVIAEKFRKQGLSIP